MEEDAANKIRDALKEWIGFDDEERKLKQQIRELNQKKKERSADILSFMRDNSVDTFALEGNGIGNITRSVRTSRPPLRRTAIRTQLLLQFADQPQRVAEVLRAIEGVPEGAEDMSVGGTQKELLSRRLPRNPRSMTLTS
jgi:hypothetical protein